VFVHVYFPAVYFPGTYFPGVAVSGALIVALEHQTTVKSWFEAGDAPTQVQFSSFIESSMPEWQVNATELILGGATGVLTVLSAVSATVGGSIPVFGAVGGQVTTVNVTASLVRMLGTGVGPQIVAATGTAAVASLFDSSSFTYTHPQATAANARTINNKFTEIFSVKDFGATGDGITDDRAFIKSAVSAMPSAGGALFFPPGTYNVDNSIRLNRPGTYFGAGRDVTFINATTAQSHVFKSDAGAITIRDMSFSSSSVRTSGAYVLVSSNDFRLQNFNMTGAFEGVRIPGTPSVVTIEMGQIRDTVAPNGVGILVQGGFALSIRDIVMDNAYGSQPVAGIRIVKSGDIKIQDCNIIHCATGLQLLANIGEIDSVWATNSFFDNCFNNGVHILGDGYTIARCRFSDCWFSSAGTNGVVIDVSGAGIVNGVDFANCHAFLNGVNGILTNNRKAININIVGGQFAQNGTSGIAFETSASSWGVIGVRSGQTATLSGNQFGLFVNGSAADNTRVVGGDFRGNTVTNMTGLRDYGLSGTNFVVIGNLG